MTWVKLHTDILSDPKLMQAARHGSRSLFLLPWLIAFAKQMARDGRLSVGDQIADPKTIALCIPNVKAKQVSECIAALLDIGVLAPDPNGIPRFTKWTERTESPSESRAAWRERKQRSRVTSRDIDPKSRNVTRDENGCHGLEVEGEGEEEVETTGDNALKALSPRKGEMGEKENSAARDRTDRDIARKRGIAKRWSAAHPEELVVMEQLVDRDMQRFKGSDAVIAEMRKGKILAEVLKRANNGKALTDVS